MAWAQIDRFNREAAALITFLVIWKTNKYWTDRLYRARTQDKQAARYAIRKADPRWQTAKKLRDAAYRAKNIELHSAYDRKLYLERTEERKSASRKYRLAHPDRVRAASHRYYGLPEPTRPMPATCECCGGPPGARALHNDHCHDTGKFRGWICGNCNKGFGLLGDTEEAVLRALAYLRKPQ